MVNIYERLHQPMIRNNNNFINIMPHNNATITITTTKPNASDGNNANMHPRKKSTTKSTAVDDSQMELRILCFDLTSYTKITQFAVSCIGIFILYILYGYLQELIFTEMEFKAYGWFITLIQFAYYICFALMERQLDVRRSGEHALSHKIPMDTYATLAVLTLGTMGLSNSSLAYLNYATQVIFKCCKLIPVMVGSIVIQGKRYGPLDFAAAALMCMGLAWFTVADSQISPNFHLLGVAMISAALVFDAAIGNVQEKAMREYHAQSSEVVLYSYGLGFLYLIVLMLLTGNFFDGLTFCLKHRWQSLGYGFLFSLSGYLGIHFVLALVRISGASMAATITTARKAVSILISFVFFHKPFTIQYVWSGAIVVFGIYLNVYSKQYKLTFMDIHRSCMRFLHQFGLYSGSSRHKFLIEV